MTRWRYPAIPEHEITPEPLYHHRRQFMKQAAGLAITAAALPTGLAAAAPQPSDQWRDALAQAPASQLSTDETLTDERTITSYNNFFEFGTRKRDPSDWGHYLQTDPWAIKVEGEVARPGLYDLNKLVRPDWLEERIYRLRCVEAWSMVIPWTGFQLSHLIEQLQPTSKAKYLVFETLYDPQQFPGQRRETLRWPYTEGLRMDEAMHPLTIMAVGLYGKPLPNQNGAPIRLVVPWKYGFKSIKSIVTLRFQEQQPVSSWQQMAPAEYGFYANVNPGVSHPRWSQATERRLGESGRRKTLMFNGYTEQVAGLYQGMDLEQFY
ncbi:protein-methionine-sulfoxide reductase catalytic subunit MsrP [Marinospirillum alkaliphilum]|uniref:Protein-methionine-sulfoxide reductase catalytic subunit MsrP n=1 Tax=Marinospirillum alkaliphilum DSM 21637 TaxID=1122209 RepID=A0A1K1VVZ7_9GAMM|nr:protein-methionine-sulfoxide reductase catalytic subunit MsrP [Marinospirillum alkaliphilum]SFX29191.1 sulfoxide reductase catalytic subunit YedY [Marinospirillum alkaliphilum DSM 21637]